MDRRVYVRARAGWAVSWERGRRAIGGEQQIKKGGESFVGWCLGVKRRWPGGRSSSSSSGSSSGGRSCLDGGGGWLAGLTRTRGGWRARSQPGRGQGTRGDDTAWMPSPTGRSIVRRHPCAKTRPISRAQWVHRLACYTRQTDCPPSRRVFWPVSGSRHCQQPTAFTAPRPLRPTTMHVSFHQATQVSAHCLLPKQTNKQTTNQSTLYVPSPSNKKNHSHITATRRKTRQNQRDPETRNMKPLPQPHTRYATSSSGAYHDFAPPYSNPQYRPFPSPTKLNQTTETCWTRPLRPQ